MIAAVLACGPCLPSFGAFARLAVESDLENLMLMAEEFIREGRKDLVWGPRTETIYEDIFRDLVESPDGGGLVIIPPKVGFACAVGAPYDSPLGEVALGWGIYVRPAHRGRGLARQLHRSLLALLRERGYDALVTGSDTPAGAAVLAGMEPVSSYGVIRLVEGGA